MGKDLVGLGRDELRLAARGLHRLPAAARARPARRPWWPGLRFAFRPGSRPSVPLRSNSRSPRVLPRGQAAQTGQAVPYEPRSAATTSPAARSRTPLRRPCNPSTGWRSQSRPSARGRSAAAATARSRSSRPAGSSPRSSRGSIPRPPSSARCIARAPRPRGRRSARSRQDRGAALLRGAGSERPRLARLRGTSSTPGLPSGGELSNMTFTGPSALAT